MKGCLFKHRWFASGVLVWLLLSLAAMVLAGEANQIPGVDNDVELPTAAVELDGDVLFRARECPGRRVEVERRIQSSVHD